MKSFNTTFKTAVLTCALLAATAAAQTTDASLSGIVTDPSGAIVPAATVVATSLATGVAQTTQSNESGLYRIPAIAPGEYSVSAQRQGFQKLSYDRITLDTGARVTLNLSLTLGNTTESVEVRADASDALNVETSTVGGVVTGRKVLELPLVGRDVYELIGTQAGVGGANNQNFNGARAGSLNVTLDGVDIRDNYLNSLSSTQIANTVSVDRIEEFRIVTSPADAEYGHGSGQVILISRSGTNAFHGSLFEELRNTVLTANTWFNNQRGQPRNFLNRNQFGGRIGGPIKKNQTFFHFHYDGRRERQHDAVTSVVYTQTARNGVYRFFPGVRNGNTNAAVPTVDRAGNPLRPLAATGDLQAVSLFGKDPNRLLPDPSGNVAHTLGLYPLPNDFRVGDGLNTGGYTFLRNVVIDYDAWDFRIDHQFNSNHRASLTYSTQAFDSTNVAGAQLLPAVPNGKGPTDTKVAGFSLTSVLRPNLINEFRAGMNRPRQTIISPWDVDPSFLGKSSGGHPFLLGFTTITSPFALNNFGSEAQDRISPVYQFGDIATWLKGKHAFRGGFEKKYVS